jgi:protein phosphatase
MLLHLTEPVVVVGDLHGHLLDLLRTLRVLGPPPARTYLFLGDLVDRGEFSTETVILIFVLKALFPTNIYCIRGNHEFAQMIEHGGFSEELLSIYHSADPESWILDAFAWIPIAALLGEAVLCVHGGIGPEVASLDQLAALPRPLCDYNSDLVQSLLWSDPSSFVDTFQYNSRGVGYLYGIASLSSFLASQGLRYMIRGHECVDGGVEMQFERKLFTVFGASRYCGQSTNKSGVMIVRPDGAKETVLFQPIPYMVRAAASFVASESEAAFVPKKGFEHGRSLPPNRPPPVRVATAGKTTGRHFETLGRAGDQHTKTTTPKLTTPLVATKKGTRLTPQKA